jgi:hypothetical protein
VLKSNAWFRCTALIRGANGAQHTLAKSFRLDLVQSVEARDGGARVKMMDGEAFTLEGDESKRFESELWSFDLGYKSVLNG